MFAPVRLAFLPLLLGLVIAISIPAWSTTRAAAIPIRKPSLVAVVVPDVLTTARPATIVLCISGRATFTVPVRMTSDYPDIIPEATFGIPVGKRCASIAVQPGPVPTSTDVLITVEILGSSLTFTTVVNPFGVAAPLRI